MKIIIDNDQPFSEYVKQVREYIKNNRADLHANVDGNKKEKIIEGNSPFILTPTEEHKNKLNGKYHRGILLTHGLTDSPYSLRSLADFFMHQGFLVYTILLPGHGTQAEDLIRVNWPDWAKVQDYGVQALAKQVDDVYLGGNSMGAALALHQVLHEYQDESFPRVKALFLFSPSLKITSKARIAWFYAALGKFFNILAWHLQLPDEDPYKYESFPHHAASQIYKLIQSIHKKMRSHEITIPIFIAASYEDVTVDPKATLDFFRHLPVKHKLMLLYSNQDIEVPEKVQLIHSHFPDEKILSYSHLSIITPADNEHYGENGSYSYCSHYFHNDKAGYERCKQQLKNYLGEVTEENLKRGVIGRLTYNPLYNDMLKEMEGFIAGLNGEDL